MEIRTVIVGTKFRGPEAVRSLMAMDKGEPVALTRDRENPHDRNAIACHSPTGSMVGYIPRNCPQQAEIAARLDAGETVTAEIAAEAIVERGDVRFPPKITIRWADAKSQ